MSGFENKLFQSPQLRQEMKINPRLYQAMELLYMPLLDLQQHLKQELSENPFLELAEADVEEEVSLEEDQDDGAEDDEIDWEEILLDGFDPGGKKAEFEETEHYQPPAVESRHLHDHLLEQLHHLDLPERERWLGEEIVGNIGDDGFLSCGLQDVVDGINEWLDEPREAAREEAEAVEDEEERQAELERVETLFRPYTMEEAESMLQGVQFLDPPGVGARDIQESLRIQLEHGGDGDSLAATIVRDHFDQLLKHRWNEIAREVGASPRDVQSAADELAKLDPKPGRRFSGGADEYIIPDLVVDRVDGEYMVFLNDTNLPRLRLSRAYREIARDKSKFKGENKEFISSKLNSANWMVHAIEQRRQTMLRVMDYIVDRQRDFFDRGVQYLKPLTLREVADHIDMHESTVSRVTNAKYVQTPRGVFPLKYFFSSGLSTASGENVSARGVKDKIRALVEQEDPRKPLTDQAIVNLLKQEGVQIARRTVAKYRDQLGVLPARMRKRV